MQQHSYVTVNLLINLSITWSTKFNKYAVLLHITVYAYPLQNINCSCLCRLWGCKITGLVHYQFTMPDFVQVNHMWPYYADRIYCCRCYLSVWCLSCRWPATQHQHSTTSGGMLVQHVVSLSGASCVSSTHSFKACMCYSNFGFTGEWLLCCIKFCFFNTKSRLEEKWLFVKTQHKQ